MTRSVRPCDCRRDQDDRIEPGTLDAVYFDARRTDREGWSVVAVVGEVDLATIPRYRAELVAAAGGSLDVAVDLTGCDLIDSVGLGVTVGAARRVRERDASFAVVVGPRTRRAFERCRLDEILHLVDSTDELGGA